MDVNSIAPYEAPMPVQTAQTQTTPAPQPTVEPASGASTNNVAKKSESNGINARTKDVNDSATEKDKHANASANQDVVEKVIEQINKSISTFNRQMHISVHAKTKRIMVKVMDTEENKVIREIPPERVLDAFAKTLELAGILVDKKS